MKAQARDRAERELSAEACFAARNMVCPRCAGNMRSAGWTNQKLKCVECKGVWQHPYR